MSSHGGEAAVQAAPPPNHDPLSAVLRSAAVQASSGGWIECRLANANREQACRSRPAPDAAYQSFVKHKKTDRILFCLMVGHSSLTPERRAPPSHREASPPSPSESSPEVRTRNAHQKASPPELKSSRAALFSPRSESRTPTLHLRTEAANLFTASPELYTPSANLETRPVNQKGSPTESNTVRADLFARRAEVYWALALIPGDQGTGSWVRPSGRETQPTPAGSIHLDATACHPQAMRVG